MRAWVEVDVRLTADGVPVLLHDSTLERTTNGRGSIAAALWADVRRLDAGETFDPAFAGEPVPALADFLEAALEYDVGVNLELKGTPEDAATVAEVALTVARALWQPGGPGANHPPPLISSFAPSALEAAARIAPDWPRGLLLDQIRPEWQADASRVDAAAVIVDHRLVLSPETVTALATDDRPVLAYTVNDPDRAAQLCRWGVSAVITDRPDAEMAKAMGMATKIRLGENNFIYGSMVTSCGGHGHNTQP